MAYLQTEVRVGETLVRKGLIINNVPVQHIELIVGHGCLRIKMENVIY